MKDQEFLIAQDDQDHNMMGYINSFKRAGTTHSKLVTVRVPIGPRFDKVAALADDGYYDSEEIARDLDGYLQEFVKLY